MPHDNIKDMLVKIWSGPYWLKLRSRWWALVAVHSDGICSTA